VQLNKQADKTVSHSLVT